MFSYTPAAADRDAWGLITDRFVLTIATDAGHALELWRTMTTPDATLESILEALVTRPGHVATYEQLMESAKQGIVTRNTVNTHILHLRQKFRRLDSNFDRIGNEYALGYRWRDE